MKNLAGKQNCDVDIERELIRCGIYIVKNQPRDGEVPSSLRGRLGGFHFFRAWNYWIVSGSVPVEVAIKLYVDPVGKTDIRVNGDYTCPFPGGQRLAWLDKDGRRLLSKSELDKVVLRHRCDNETAEYILDIAKRNFHIVDDPKSEGKAFISIYHIDTEIGLRLFVDALKKHKLV